MTLRAIVIGFFAAIIYAAGGRYVQAYVQGPYMVRGHMPILVFGLLFFFIVTINPLLGWIKQSIRFKPRELALIFVMMLSVSFIIEAGMMKWFPSISIFPIHFAQTQPSWETARVMDYVPDVMMVDDKRMGPAVDDFLGAGEPIAWPSPWWRPSEWTDPEFRESLGRSWDRVPWGAWRKPLVFWGVMYVLSFAAVVSMSVVLHRQWARRERIRYPIAEIANALVMHDEAGRNPMLRNKLFWLGFAVAVFIGLIDMAMLWDKNPAARARALMTLDLSVLAQSFPNFMRTSGANFLATVELYPIAIGLAFLVAADVSFTIGISVPVIVTTLFVLGKQGFDLSGHNVLAGNYLVWQSFGGYLAFGILILYTGRRYYWYTAREALLFMPHEDTDRPGVWGCRIFVLSVTGLIVTLIAVGLAWHMAVITVMLIMLSYMVVSRLSAEAGTFFYTATLFVGTVLMGMYGFATLGPAGYLIIMIVMHALARDSYEWLMPYVVNGLKTTSDTGLKVGRIGLVIGGTILCAAVVAVFFGLWSDYQEIGYRRGGSFSRYAYVFASTEIQKLQLSGELEKVVNYTSWERLANMQPDKTFLVSSAIGFGAVLLLNFLRLRFMWWPIHPLLVLIFGPWAMGQFGASFFVGWFLRMVIVKLTGTAHYRQLRPMMIGLVIGSIVIAFITLATLYGLNIIGGSTSPEWQAW